MTDSKRIAQSSAALFDGQLEVLAVPADRAVHRRHRVVPDVPGVRHRHRAPARGRALAVVALARTRGWRCRGGTATSRRRARGRPARPRTGACRRDVGGVGGRRRDQQAEREQDETEGGPHQGIPNTPGGANVAVMRSLPHRRSGPRSRSARRRRRSAGRPGARARTARRGATPPARHATRPTPVRRVSATCTDGV